MQRPDNELQIRIKECKNPTFGYRRGKDGEIENCRGSMSASIEPAE